MPVAHLHSKEQGFMSRHMNDAKIKLYTVYVKKNSARNKVEKNDIALPM